MKAKVKITNPSGLLSSRGSLHFNSEGLVSKEGFDAGTKETHETEHFTIELSKSMATMGPANHYKLTVKNKKSGRFYMKSIEALTSCRKLISKLKRDSKKGDVPDEFR